ncbi:uncharacterized protein GGS22DRAFT_189091 [Annulohypoxylon maeteangense]|uniref:uncharacterized protein n=1 Tax=Annulohypoxylon maeteangense TaxID=1927788 RepID=UPI00200875F0|nr:uncharacterized protein GGS22DRAFT_189091 [Annulohypoxylon maeteangense]KAI0884877.1 hypothetical protein GGS22DRAFT_189091 [Annulohypoxylon maeteangense]
MASSQKDQNGDKGLYAFLRRYQQYEADKDRTDVLIKDLLMYTENTESRLLKENGSLRQQLNNAHMDLESVKKSLQETKRRLGDMEDRNPYIMVLIDGDGLIFKDHLVKQGVEGGRKAANELNSAILEKFNYTGDTPITVVAKVVANVLGLSRAMKWNSCIPSEITLYDFISGFSQIRPDFEFVDVGQGKERADAKIIDSARFHLRNFNCKQVVMGISHNSGYGPFLDGLINNNTTKQRITILEGTPTVQAIVSIGVGIMNCHTIFRSEKLLSRVPQDRAQTTMSIGPSYAAIAQTKVASPPPQITLPIALKKTAAPARPVQSPPPEWYPGPRGFDKPIAVNQAVLERLKKRKGEDKLCNNHFLRGPCSKGDECKFEHDYNPTKEEMKVIALFARLNPCTSGQDCDVDNCIYGHHCPSTINGVCTNARCKFEMEDHPPGVKFKHSRLSE